MPTLVIELPPIEEQTAFNLQRWAEIQADPEWEKYQGRIETDRHGHILMSPSPNYRHGRLSARIAWKLEELMDEGSGSVESPISTRDGIRIADASWISGDLLDEAETMLCLDKAPEICVEVLSPRNRLSEMKEKKDLYFEAGAKEVWFCDRDGDMTFFVSAQDAGSKRSRVCPDFPEWVDPRPKRKR